LKLWKLAAGGAIGMAIASHVLKHQRPPSVSMHEQDWVRGAPPIEGRSYKSLAHFIHHQKELLAMLDVIAEIYILRALTPAFREQVMVVTAFSNACPP
jgi:hypothetical protein